jgi:hypothetical protein
VLGSGTARRSKTGIGERIAEMAPKKRRILKTLALRPELPNALEKQAIITACEARQRIRIEGGGYHREHLRALAQRVEVADREVRIMGSKSDLLRTLAAISGVKSATGGVRSSVLAEREGFEPPIGLHLCRISSAVHSTTLPPLRGCQNGRSPARSRPMF